MIADVACRNGPLSTVRGVDWGSWFNDEGWIWDRVFHTRLEMTARVTKNLFQWHSSSFEILLMKLYGIAVSIYDTMVALFG